jgi:hypothetical protein
MRLCFVSLLTLNLVVLALQWISERAKAPLSIYSERPGVQRVQLLQESNVVDAGQAAQPGSQCLLLGPMAGEAAATYWQRQFAWAGVASESVLQKVVQAPSYMVYFGPLSDRQKAQISLREFHERKIDSFVVSSGRFENAISLGVFENIDLARVRMSALKEQGFAVQMGEIERHKDEFWVLVSDPYVDENKEKIDGIIRSNSKLPEMRQIFCKSVASKKGLP